MGPTVETSMLPFWGSFWLKELVFLPAMTSLRRMLQSLMNTRVLGLLSWNVCAALSHILMA